jgi:signal peptidase II
MMTKQKSGLCWLWVAVLALVIDLLCKQWVLTHVALGESVPLVPFFNLYYAQNFGAAFSFLAEHSGWQRWLFSLIAVAISVALLVMMYRTQASKRINNIAYALIIGGALGNLFDRLVHGFVVDFIDFYVNNWHYPTFNIADSAICIGAALIVLEGFLSPANKNTH